MEKAAPTPAIQWSNVAGMAAPGSNQHTAKRTADWRCGILLFSPTRLLQSQGSMDSTNEFLTLGLGELCGLWAEDRCLELNSQECLVKHNHKHSRQSLQAAAPEQHSCGASRKFKAPQCPRGGRCFSRECQTLSVAHPSSFGVLGFWSHWNSVFIGYASHIKQSHATHMVGQICFAWLLDSWLF